MSNELIARPPVVVDDQPTLAFTTYCVEWFAGRGGLTVPDVASLHSAGQSWLWFETPKGLGYKAGGWAKLAHAGVDLYVKHHGFAGTADELDSLLAEIGVPDGFHRTVGPRE